MKEIITNISNKEKEASSFNFVLPSIDVTELSFLTIEARNLHFSISKHLLFTGNAQREFIRSHGSKTAVLPLASFIQDLDTDVSTGNRI